MLCGLHHRFAFSGYAIFTFATALAAYAPPTFATAVGDADGCAVNISGEITQATVIEMRKFLPPITPICGSGPVFRFNSPGGDVQAAIQIGRTIRLLKGHTVVARNSICASACVLSFLGGVTRVGEGRFGLHRPYSTQLTDSTNQAQQIHEKINAAIAQYLTTVNIPVRLLDLMNSIPPEYVRWLSVSSGGEQLAELRIVGVDPVYNEELDSSEAKRYGITKSEYYDRKQKASAICIPNPPRGVKPENCFEAVFRGFLTSSDARESGQSSSPIEYQGANSENIREDRERRDRLQKLCRELRYELTTSCSPVTRWNVDSCANMRGALKDCIEFGL